MAILVELDADTDALVQSIARKTGQTASEVIRASVSSYYKKEIVPGELTYYDLIKDTIEPEDETRPADMPVDLGREGERYLRERFARIREQQHDNDHR